MLVPVAISLVVIARPLLTSDRCLFEVMLNVTEGESDQGGSVSGAWSAHHTFPLSTHRELFPSFNYWAR